MIPHLSINAEEPNAWTFTVVHAHGLRLLWPQRAWRPVVTVMTDAHETHEAILGTDGQNVNLKAPFLLHDVTPDSRVEIRVWQCPQTKKKSKKRRLVGSACPTLRELYRQQSTEARADIRLRCEATNGAVRGRPQNGAYLTVRVQAPAFSPEPLVDLDKAPHSLECNTNSDVLSDTSSPSSLDDFEPLLDDIGPANGMRRRITGYAIDSEEEDQTLDSCEDSREFDSFLDPFDESNDYFIPATQNFIHRIAASLLPTYTDQISVNSTMSAAESFLETFSMYRELREACTDSEFERILSRQQAEWFYVGGSLVALAGLDATVFGIAPGANFHIDDFDKRVVAVGSVACGLGLFIDAYFLLRYSGASSAKFQRRAMDVYGTYFYFCLSSRVPALCMFVSACALMIFLLRVAWTAWPLGTIVLCLIAGLLVTLQFVVYGLHQFARRVARVSIAFAQGVVYVSRRLFRYPVASETEASSSK